MTTATRKTPDYYTGTMAGAAMLHFLEDEIKGEWTALQRCRKAARTYRAAGDRAMELHERRLGLVSKAILKTLFAVRKVGQGRA